VRERVNRERERLIDRVYRERLHIWRDHRMSRKRGSDKSTFQARARESLKRKLLQISCIANIYTERVSRERERERERERGSL